VSGSDACAYPRVVVAGTGGDSGKTLLSLGILLLARRSGWNPRAFKKGPDYIDASWLRWASGREARNLDTYLMGFPGALSGFLGAASPDQLNVIEGNRGLYDGSDAAGTHSTAALSKHLKAPVVLVLNCTKRTRTVAAIVLGCRRLEPDVHVAGVVLNQLAGSRHERVVREAVEAETRIPVLGALPRIPPGRLLPGRHLGLVTPEEHPRIRDLEQNLLDLCAPHLDLEAIMAIARKSPALASPESPPLRPIPVYRPRIGLIRDSAFTFYYPENLEALEAEGACLQPLSPLSGEAFPNDLDGLYIGGGFPETHGSRISERSGWLSGLAEAASAGLPVYAECGGLMLLSRSLIHEGSRHPMAGVFQMDTEVYPSPQGHGYAELEVDRTNPFFEVGTRLRGHEFHYSAAHAPETEPPTACSVLRGTGVLPGRDSLLSRSVWAAYTHLHAAATPEWASGLFRASAAYRLKKQQGL